MYIFTSHITLQAIFVWQFMHVSWYLALTYYCYSCWLERSMYCFNYDAKSGWSYSTSLLTPVAFCCLFHSNTLILVNNINTRTILITIIIIIIIIVIVIFHELFVEKSALSLSTCNDNEWSLVSNKCFPVIWDYYVTWLGILICNVYQYVIIIINFWKHSNVFACDIDSSIDWKVFIWNSYVYRIRPSVYHKPWAKTSTGNMTNNFEQCEPEPAQVMR